MWGSRSELVPFDPEIEKTARANQKVAQEALVDESASVSSDNESGQKEETMAYQQPQTMGEYCKQTDAWKISMGVVPDNPTTFEIKNYVLSGLMDNSFDGNEIWDR